MEKIFVAKDLKIKWVGLFDFAELYKVIKEFLEDKKMFNEKTLEKKYVEKSKPGGKQLKFFGMQKFQEVIFLNIILT
ncbi:hypothetical protein K8R47_02755 [archaeon]|nr:hypothetical protein [archaeon]